MSRSSLMWVLAVLLAVGAFVTFLRSSTSFTGILTVAALATASIAVQIQPKNFYDETPTAPRRGRWRRNQGTDDPGAPREQS